MLLTYVTIVKYTALKLGLICRCVTQLSFQAVFGLGCCFDCSCGDMTEGKNRYFLDKLIKEEKQSHPSGSCRDGKRRRTKWCSERQG